MSYFPHAQRAKLLVSGMRFPVVRSKAAPVLSIADMNDPRFDWDTLRQVLLAMTCPVPCAGVRRPGTIEDWHAECEARADAAVEIVRSLGMPAWPRPKLDPA